MSKLSELTGLAGVDVAVGDLFFVVDISEPVPANRNKSITKAQLAIAVGGSGFPATTDLDMGGFSLTNGGLAENDEDFPTYGQVQGYVTGNFQQINAALTALAAGSDFVKFVGPANTVKTFTLPDASAALATTSTRLDQFAAPTATVSFNSQLISNVATPVSGTDGATKAYVDSVAQGAKWKASVRVATTGNGTLATAFASGSTVDGVILATGDRVLLKDQTDGTANGIYVVPASGAPTRDTDADTGSELVAAATFASEGTANAGKSFINTNSSITLGVTSIVFVNMASASGALIGSNNLSDIPSPSAARTNLGVPTGSGTSTGSNSGDQPSSSAATASVLALRDANANLSANNYLSGYTTTVTATGTTTLTVDSKRLQYFTGVTIQNCKLPVTSTLTLGHEFEIVNNSTGAVTIQSSGGSTVMVANANTRYKVTCILTSGTGAASWEYELVGFVPSAGMPLFMTVPSLTNLNATITGDVVVGRATTDTLTGKRITKRTLASANPGATLSINTDSYDVCEITGQTADIAISVSGTPVAGDLLRVSITGTASRALSWSASFESSLVSLPTTTTGTATLDVGFRWNSATSKWRCLAVA